MLNSVTYNKAKINKLLCCPPRPVEKSRNLRPAFFFSPNHDCLNLQILPVFQFRKCVLKLFPWSFELQTCQLCGAPVNFRSATYKMHNQSAYSNCHHTSKLRTRLLALHSMGEFHRILNRVQYKFCKGY